MENNLEIKVVDMFRDCMKDKSNSKIESKNITDDRKPEGYVEVYEIDEKGNKQLVGKHNLVVYLGREWVAQRLFATANTHLVSPNNPQPDEWICWLGVGMGGAPESDPLIPIPPTNDNTDLTTPVIIYPGEEANTYGDWYESMTTAGWRKKPCGTPTFSQDPNNNNRYLVINVETTLDVGEADGEVINEVGLFTCNSSAGGTTGPTHPFHLYARVTFSTIPKTSDRRLLFSWFIYV